MKQIIAWGGSGFAVTPTNLAAMRYVMAQCPKSAKSIAFLPQASLEDPRYIVQFYALCQHLGLKGHVLSLFGRVQDGWQKMLLEQDIIVVGGGNTKSMLALWRAWGVDAILDEAYHRGVVLTGGSAGAICWFEQGVSDSVWPLGIIPGLGWLKDSCCVHYNSEPERRPAYETWCAEGKIKPGLALYDYVAGHYIEGTLVRAVSPLATGQAFWVDQGQSMDYPVEMIE